MRRVLVIATVFLTACGTTSGVGDVADLDTLTETYGCGFGFWIGNADQTTALRFAYQGDGPPPESVTLPDPDWRVELIDGRDLYANWCDDVIEPGEPQAQPVRSLPVVAGSLRIIGDAPQPFEGGSLTLEATDLAVEVGDGEAVELGDIEIANESWGFLAG